MSHLENESRSPYRHLISFSAQELKQLRKRKNLWFAGTMISLVAWLYLMIATIPLGMFASLAAFVMLGPLVVTGVIGGTALHEYRPKAEDADFVKTWRRFFQEWMAEGHAEPHGFHLVTVNVSMSSENPGVLRVEVLHFEPMYEHMVFDLGAEFVGGYSSADPKEVFPILLDAVSNAAMAGARTEELEHFFSTRAIPAVSNETREAMSLRGDD